MSVRVCTDTSRTRAALVEAQPRLNPGGLQVLPKALEAFDVRIGRGKGRGMTRFINSTDMNYSRQAFQAMA